MRLYIVITLFNIISDSTWWRILCSELVLLPPQGKGAPQAEGSHEAQHIRLDLLR